MEYAGRDSNKDKCEMFIKQQCYVERTPQDAENIQIVVYKSNDHDIVAEIAGFLYNYKDESNWKKMDSFHIQTLYTNQKYLKRGIATYLMKEAIKYAETKRVKHITTHPCAMTETISQKDLMEFYRKFTFIHKCILRTSSKNVEFRVVID